MDSALIKIVAMKCRSNSFDNSTSDVPHYRHLLKAHPCQVIQARITFDSICKIELSTLKPIQLQRLSTLKSELISILTGEDDDHNTCSLKEL